MTELSQLWMVSKWAVSVVAPLNVTPFHVKGNSLWQMVLSVVTI
jgi:hypothetical protein